MILTPHIIIGGLAASQTSNYLLAGLIGLLSHYALDMIPHHEYPIDEFETTSKTRRIKFNKAFWIDLFKVCLDAVTGFTLLFAIYENFHPNFEIKKIIIVFTGGLFGLLPDALQFMHWILPSKLLKLSYNFQYWIHTKIKPGALIGTVTQIVSVLIMVMGFYLFK